MDQGGYWSLSSSEVSTHKELSLPCTRWTVINSSVKNDGRLLSLINFQCAAAAATDFLKLNRDTAKFVRCYSIII